MIYGSRCSRSSTQDEGTTGGGTQITGWEYGLITGFRFKSLLKENTQQTRGDSSAILALTRGRKCEPLTCRSPISDLGWSGPRPGEGRPSARQYVAGWTGGQHPGFSSLNYVLKDSIEKNRVRGPPAPPGGPPFLGMLARSAEGLPSTRNWSFRWPLPLTSPP
jgi:hypothetical protein